MIKGWICLGIVGAILLAVPLPVEAQEATGALARGREALDAGRFEAAEEALFQAAETTPQDTEVHYLLARLYLETPRRDLRAAARAVDRALDIRPDDLRFLDLKLRLADADTPPAQLRAGNDAQAALAGRILAREPGHPYAHLVIGRRRAAAFAADYDALGLADFDAFPPVAVQEAPQTASVYGLEAFAEDGTIRLEQRGPQVAGDVPVVRRQEQALGAYAEAVDHLTQSLTADPSLRPAFDLLVKLYARRGDYAAMRSLVDTVHVLDDAGVLLYQGLAAYETGDLARAEARFRAALAALPEAERQAFQDVRRFLAGAERDAYAADPPAYRSRFWHVRDPRLLSAVNERELAHYTRMVYADLRFGDETIRGWETEPGDVVVRYGVPGAEARYATFKEDYLLFHYGDLQFKFMRINRTGRYTFYSPPAQAFSNPRTINRVWANDYALRARETFREVPERFDALPARQVAFPAVAYWMKGARGRTDVYITLGVPVSRPAAGGYSPSMVETGAFLLDPHGRPLAADRLPLQRVDVAPEAYAATDPLWVDTRWLEAPAGAFEWAAEFSADGGATVGVVRQPVEIPAFDAGELVLSDLVLAYDVHEGSPRDGWMCRRGTCLQPAPSRRFSRGQPLRVYFEAYALAQESGGTRYTVEAMLAPAEEGRAVGKLLRGAFGGERPAAVSVRFEQRGTTTEARQTLALDVGGQPLGVYVLAVRVVDRIAGRAAEAWQVVQLE